MPDGEVSLNRHQRRRRAAQQRRYSIADFHDDAAGVFSVGVLTPLDVAALMLTNQSIAASLIDWLNRIEQTRPLCAYCDTVFTREEPPTMWLLAQAVGNPGARGIMLMGACEACCVRYPTNEALLAAVADVLKRGAWPDLRTLDPAHFGPGGRA